MINSIEQNLIAENPRGLYGVTIESHYHSKKKFNFSLVVMAARVDQFQFNDLRAAAGAHRGWYSRKFGSCPGGFAFMQESDAQAFADELCGKIASGETNPDEESEREPAPVEKPNHKQKFFNLADMMQDAIAECFADRQENTPKRQAQAARKRHEGARLERTQKALRVLSTLYERDEVPEVLQDLHSKAAVYALMGENTSEVQNGYHGYSIGTGERSSEDPAAVMLWQLIGKDPQRAQAEEQKAKINGLQFANIPGFFNTTGDALDFVIDRAELEPYHYVLEPEAGAGDMALRILETVGEPNGSGLVQVFEINHTLCEILTGRGFPSESLDFLKIQPGQVLFDRVVMNPPFEKMQDCEHVKHAFGFLKPGGRLVAVMSPSWQTNSTNNAEEFRTWFEAVGGHVEPMPEGSFKSAGTGVNCVLVTLEAPEIAEDWPPKTSTKSTRAPTFTADPEHSEPAPKPASLSDLLADL